MSWYLAQVVAGNQQKNVAGSQWCSVTVRAESHCQCQVSPSCLGWCPLSLPVSDLECCDFLSLGNTPQSLDRRVTLHLTSAAGSMADYRPWIQRAMTLFFFFFCKLISWRRIGTSLSLTSFFLWHPQVVPASMAVIHSPPPCSEVLMGLRTGPESLTFVCHV